MKPIAILFGCAISLFAQRPSNPALLVPQEAPLLDYVAVPDPLPVPDAAAMGASSDVTFDSKGHLYVLSRGAKPLTEFDENGKFVRAFGDGLFTRSHGIRIDKDGKFEVAHGIAIDAKGLLWVTDRENQRIQIFDQDGKYIREVKYAGLPCSLDIGKQNIYMVNGFAGQLLKLDLEGKVLAAVGKPGAAGTWGEFGEAHFIAVSPKGEIYIADSVNRAVQKFVKK